MCYIEMKDAKLPRRIVEAVTGYNQAAAQDDIFWPETIAGRRAHLAKATVFFLFMISTIVGWGPELFSQTHDIGVALLVPAFAFAIGNALTFFLFRGETLTSFVTSRLFGVAAAPELYLRRAEAKGVIELKKCEYTHDYD